MKTWVKTRFDDHNGLHEVGEEFDWPTPDPESIASVKVLIEQEILSDRPIDRPPPTSPPVGDVDQPSTAEVIQDEIDAAATPGVVVEDEPVKARRARKRAN